MKELENRSVTDHQPRAALDEFRALLEQAATEAVWQAFFDAHPFVLFEAEAVRSSDRAGVFQQTYRAIRKELPRNGQSAAYSPIQLAAPGFER
jgi:hypothetical protein